MKRLDTTAGMVACLVWLAGCTVHVDPTPEAKPWTGANAGGGWIEPGPFEVAQMRVYPLTRLDRNRSGGAILVLQLELTDRWGDTTKGVGEVSVRAMPTTGVGAEERWEATLNDLERNASLYDTSSRTYRLVLGDLPAWLGALAPDGDGGKAPGSGGVRIDVELVTPAAGRQQRRLSDSFEID